MQRPVPDVLRQWASEQGFDCGNINSRIENAVSPLMLAAMNGDIDKVGLLLEAGADVNLLNDDENDALWFACFSNQPMMVRELVRAGSRIDNQNVNGATCLIYAASTGRFDIVRELVEAGADIRKKTLDGFNALDSATTLPILKFLKPLYATA